MCDKENWGKDIELGSVLNCTSHPTVVWDCDGVLWTVDSSGKDYINSKCRKNIGLLKAMKAWGFTTVVWTRGGLDHAEQCVRFCDIHRYVDRIASKTEAKEINADICFDDERVMLAKLNIKV